jgi:hypothetical protein
MMGEKGIVDNAMLLTSYFTGIVNSPSKHSNDNLNKAGTYLL